MTMFYGDLYYEAKSTTDLEHQQELNKINDDAVKCGLALNSTITLDIQRKLVKENNLEILKCLLLNRNLLPELFTEIFSKLNKEVFTSNLKFNHPETQKLLNTALLLL